MITPQLSSAIYMQMMMGARASPNRYSSLFFLFFSLLLSVCQGKTSRLSRDLGQRAISWSLKRLEDMDNSFTVIHLFSFLFFFFENPTRSAREHIQGLC